MDVEYARLARIIPLPEGIQVTVPKATVVTNAQQAYTSPPPEEVMKTLKEKSQAANLMTLKSTIYLFMISNRSKK